MDFRRVDARRIIAYTQIILMLCMLAACSFLFPNKLGNFNPRTESIFGGSQPGVCKMGMSDNDAQSEVNDAILNDPEAQKLQDILSQLGLSLDTNSATGCMVDEEAIQDNDDSTSGSTSSASVRTQNVFGQQTAPEIQYTTTPAGTNGLLHMVEGVNEENNLWLSWQQNSNNEQRKMITHVELFGDNSALNAALAQNMALGVRFTTLDDYNKRRLIHELAQYTTMGQGAQYAPAAQSADGVPEVTSLQFGGQLLDVKKAQAVIVNQMINPGNPSQLYGEALVVLPLISNSRGVGVVNFALDDALYVRIPVVADANRPIWQIPFSGSNLPDPMNEPKHWVPTASFVYSPSEELLINEDIEFDGSASTDSDGTIVDYLWNFGDGTSINGDAVETHQYTASGTYQVSLTVVDNHGNASSAATTQIDVGDPLPPFDPNEMRVKIWSTSSSSLKIKVFGHDSWTTQHDFRIDLSGIRYEDIVTGDTENTIFTSASGSVSGDAQTTTTQHSTTTPLLTGSVGTGSVTYTLGMDTDIWKVSFTVKLDMDGDGTKEAGPGVVPIYVAVGSDQRKVDRSHSPFTVKDNGYDMLPMSSWSGLQHCNGSGSSCLVFTASAAASSSMLGTIGDHFSSNRDFARQKNGWSSPVTSRTASVSSAQANSIILDPEILDYWSTPLVIPRDFSLTTDSLNDITRDNFYRN